MSVAFNPVRDIPSLDGKVILVTGGNTGLGKETVLQLAKHNPSAIFLAARSRQKAEEAIAEVKAAVPKSNIVFLHLDLASFSSIQSAATAFMSQSDRLDVLINNAGIMACPMGTTKEGYEIQFGTNHVGPALFTKLMLPTLLRTAEQPGSDVRIVNLSSAAHQMAPKGGIIFDKAELAEQTPWKRYGQTKLANILHAQQLARHYPNITCVAVHPGTIQTDLWNSNMKMNSFVRYGVQIFGGLWMQGVAEGAKNQLWAATAKGVQTGTFYNPVGKRSAGTSYAQDEQLAEKLWQWTEDELKSHGH